MYFKSPSHNYVLSLIRVYLMIEKFLHAVVWLHAFDFFLSAFLVAKLLNAHNTHYSLKNSMCGQNIKK